MTVQEFYDWCKKLSLTGAELEISLESFGRDNDSVPVTEWNIDYGLRKLPCEKTEKFVKLGG